MTIVDDARMREKYTPSWFGDVETELREKMLELERDLTAEIMAAHDIDALAIEIASRARLPVLVATALGLVAACKSTPAPPPRDTDPAPAPQRSAPLEVCPDSMTAQPTWPWIRELFPGCPPAPFRHYGVSCDGGCPRPCRARIVQPGYRDPIDEKYTYDREGRWVRTQRYWTIEHYGEQFVAEMLPPGDGPFGRRTTYCSRDGNGGGNCAIEKLNAVPRNTPHVQLMFRYDDDGRVTSAQDPMNDAPLATYSYEAGRLRRELVASPGDSGKMFEYSYDADGRLARKVSSGWGDHESTEYTYDRLDRLVSISGDWSHGSRYETTWEHDDRGRPLRILTIATRDGREKGRWDVTYEYNCPEPLPFAEAVKEVEAFGARICICADEACTKAVFDEFDRWRNGRTPLYQDHTRSEWDRYLKAVESLGQCPAGP